MLRWAWCVVIVIGLCSPVWADPFPVGALPGLDISGGLPGGYDPRLDRLFVVSDGGTVSHMEADGNGVVNWSVGGDLEGITVADPNSDLIYLGVEHPDGISEFDIGTGLVTRTFDLTPWMTGPNNSGSSRTPAIPKAACSTRACRTTAISTNSSFRSSPI